MTAFAYIRSKKLNAKGKWESEQCVLGLHDLGEKLELRFFLIKIEIVI